MSDKTTKQIDIKVGAPGAEKVPGMMDRISHSLHEMNAEARKGTLHGLETIFRGAGAGAGIYAAAEGVKRLTEAMEAYASGQMKANEALDDFLKGLPLFGQVYEATHGVIGLMTGAAKIEAEIKRAEGIEAAAQQARAAEAATYGEIFKKRYAETHPEMGTHLFELLRERRRLGAQLSQRQNDDELREISKGTRFEAMVERRPNEEALLRASKANWAAVVQNLEKTAGEFAGQFSKMVAEPFEKAGGFIGTQIGKGMEDSMLEKGRMALGKLFGFIRPVADERLWNTIFPNHQAINYRDLLGGGQAAHPDANARTAFGAPLSESRFLTGAGSRDAQSQAVEDTAKNTKDTAKGIENLPAAIGRAIGEAVAKMFSQAPNK